MDADGSDQDWKRIARQAILDKRPFCTDCVIFVDRQSLADEKVLMVQSEPNDGSPLTVGRCPAALGTLNAVGVNLGSLDLEDALTQGVDSELLWQHQKN